MGKQGHYGMGVQRARGRGARVESKTIVDGTPAQSRSDGARRRSGAPRPLNAVSSRSQARVDRLRAPYPS